MLYFISIAALIALFAIGTMTPINMGVLAFAAAFVVGGWVSGIPIDDIFDAFPGDIFLIVAGITLLFAIAKANGTINIIVGSALAWSTAALGAGVDDVPALRRRLMAMGSPMAAGMLAPIAMRLARKKKINPLLMGMAINHGALGCAFSPITDLRCIRQRIDQIRRVRGEPAAAVHRSPRTEHPVPRRTVRHPRPRPAPRAARRPMTRLTGDTHRRRQPHRPRAPIPAGGADLAAASATAVLR